MGKDSDKQGKSAVRGRVARHLKRLLIPGVIGLGACKGTEQTPVVCDPLAAPMDASGAPMEGADSGVLVPSQRDDAGPPPVVCDPMPAPMPKPPKNK